MRTRKGWSSARQLALVLTTASAVVVVAGVSQVAIAQAPTVPPLTTEWLRAASGLSGQAGTIDIQADCNPVSGRPTISYTATGPAAGQSQGALTIGPYPGTYSETGTATLERVNLPPFPPSGIAVPLVAFQAQFTIDSPAGRVTGTKQWEPTPFPVNFGYCHTRRASSGDFDVGFHAFVAAATYTAVITTATGTCTTQGSARVNVAEQDAPGHANVDFHRFDEHFTSGTPPVCTSNVVQPTSKDQCKKGGWREFTNPSFKNQGQCVAWVNHHDGKGKDDEKSKSKSSEKTRGEAERANDVKVKPAKKK